MYSGVHPRVSALIQPSFQKIEFIISTVVFPPPRLIFTPSFTVFAMVVCYFTGETLNFGEDIS